MPYSESKGQFWADPVNPARVGDDLTLPPTVVQPEVALPLNPAWDHKRFVNLYSNGTNHVLAVISREPVTQTYHVMPLVWQSGAFSVGNPVDLPQLHYVYDARTVVAGGKTFLVLTGIDFATEHNPPWVRALELVTTPAYGLTLHPLQYVSTPTPDDTYYRTELAIGRQDNHVIVLHDKEVRVAPGVTRQWLFYRAYSVGADGNLSPLCPDTGVPGYSSGSDPGVWPEIELFEVEPANGLYLMNFSPVGGNTQVHLVAFDPSYGIALGSPLSIPFGNRYQVLAVHPLTSGKLAVVMSFDEIWVLAYGANQSLSLQGSYDDLEDGGVMADDWGIYANYAYGSFAGSFAWPHAKFEDEAPLRYLPAVYYEEVNFFTRVGLIEVDPEYSGTLGVAQIRRRVQTDDQQAAYWALEALAPNRVLLVMRYEGTSTYHLGAIYEWTSGGSPPPEPVTPVSAPQEVLRGFTNRLDGFGRPKRLEGRDKLESTMGFIVLELLLQRGLLRQTLSETDRGAIAAQIQEALEDPANWWPEQLAPVSLSEVRITRRSATAAGGVAAEGDPEGNLQIEIEYGEVTTGVVVPTETRTLVIPFGAYAQEE